MDALPWNVGIGIGEYISLKSGTKESRTAPKEQSPIFDSLNPGNCRLSATGSLAKSITTRTFDSTTGERSNPLVNSPHPPEALSVAEKPPLTNTPPVNLFTGKLFNPLGSNGGSTICVVKWDKVLPLSCERVGAPKGGKSSYSKKFKVSLACLLPAPSKKDPSRVSHSQEDNEKYREGKMHFNLPEKLSPGTKLRVTSAFVGERLLGHESTLGESSHVAFLINEDLDSSSSSKPKKSLRRWPVWRHSEQWKGTPR
jgi:hypothetical protein